jgi:hypothetical protein
MPCESQPPVGVAQLLWIVRPHSSIKNLSKILLWQIPQRYFRAFCGVGGGLFFLAAFYLGFSGHGQSALIFLLFGTVGLSGALRRKAP